MAEGAALSRPTGPLPHREDETRERGYAIALGRKRVSGIRCGKSRERIDKANSSGFKIRSIACDNGQVIDERNGGYLLVDWMLRAW